MANNDNTVVYLASYILSNDDHANQIITITEIDVPFVNLSGATIDAQVSKRRMRTLFDRDADVAPDFGINGHTRFHYGATENPQIGTI